MGPYDREMSEEVASRLAATIRFAVDQPQQLTVTDLADHARYSPAHFARAFTGAMGMGPGQYLTALRIAESKRLLLTSGFAVVDVAMESGFDSLSSFTRRFRSAVGTPPAQFRRLAQELGERSLSPFELQMPGPDVVRVEISLPAGFSPRGDASVWVGWYPRPVPIGLPHGGILTRGRTSVDLTLCPGAPFLLAFAVPDGADPHQQLAPTTPVVCGHHAPITGPCTVRLSFGQHPDDRYIPLLSALPSLVHHRLVR